MSRQHFEFKPKDVCSTWMSFDIENDKLVSYKSRGGCGGNLLGIKKLVEGMDIDDVIFCLRGTKCGENETSCPDQLAQALEEYKKGER